MTPVRPEFVPDPSLSREEMEQLQRDLADEAAFEDAFDFDPTAITGGTRGIDRSGGTGGSEGAGDPGNTRGSADAGQLELGDASSENDASTGSDAISADAPVVAGVDQAFTPDGERAISAIVAARNGEVIERAYAVEPTDVPYIPGLLSFREGGAILSAFEALSVEPDLAVVDGSGRIHFRQAGIATHIGVTLDLPAVGVAKSLLCGTPREPLDDPLSRGARVAIEADQRVTAPDGAVIGYAYQSRQYDNPEKRYVNPLYVSPGHRVSAETTTDLVERLCAGYKLPEPTRLADSYADEVKAEVGE